MNQHIRIPLFDHTPKSEVTEILDDLGRFGFSNDPVHVQNGFTLDALPEDVEAVEIVMQDPNGAEGFVLCRLSGARYATWRYNRGNPDVYYWGHYFDGRDEALRDLFARAGFGVVEALTV